MSKSITVTKTVENKPQKPRKPKRRNRRNQIQNLPKAATIPVASSRPWVSNQPRIRQTSIKSCRIVHRELVDNFEGPAVLPAFVPVAYPLNPGMDATFSWLSNIALNWERYKFHKLSFHFLTRVPSTTAGSIMMAPDYDPADAPPIDELTLLSYQDARDNSVWKDTSVICDPKALAGGRNDHFVRSAPLAANLDIKTYDGGTLFIATDTVNGTMLGKLFVEYDVEFYNPQLPPSGDPIIANSSFGNGASGMSAAKPFGTFPATSSLSNLGIMSGNVTSNNVIPIISDAAQTILTTNFVGSVMTGANAPTVTDKLGNAAPAVVTTLNAFMANTGATQCYANWGISKLRKDDIVNIGALSAATVTAATAVLSSVVAGSLNPNS